MVVGVRDPWSEYRVTRERRPVGSATNTFLLRALSRVVLLDVPLMTTEQTQEPTHRISYQSVGLKIRSASPRRKHSVRPNKLASGLADAQQSTRPTATTTNAAAPPQPRRWPATQQPRPQPQEASSTRWLLGHHRCVSNRPRGWEGRRPSSGKLAACCNAMMSAWQGQHRRTARQVPSNCVRP